MSDTKLRDLERRWKETGTVDDEAAYLLERVRVGNLNQERLELAAYCGHEAAIRALNVATTARALSDAHWAYGFAVWPDAANRVGAALASVAAASVSALPAVTVADAASVAVTIDSWVLDPTEERARAMRRRVSVPGLHEDEGEAVWRQRHAARAASNLTRLSSPIRRSQALTDAVELLVSAGVTRIRDLVAGEVVPWALGYGDPVRERIDARRGETAHGTVDEQAACLVERVRVGSLTRERLELAAHCGHEGAIHALRVEVPPVDHATWLAGLEIFGRETVVRSGLAFVHTCLLQLWDAGPWRDDRRIESLFRALEVDLIRPCAASKVAVDRTLSEALRAAAHADERTDYAGGDTCSNGPAWAAHAVCRVPELGRGIALVDLLRPPIGIRITDVEKRELLVEELLPWAMGWRDPVEARVAARSSLDRSST